MNAGCEHRADVEHWSNTGERFRTYTPEGQPVIDKAENLISLRQDLHFAWDRTDFSLLPKEDGDGTWKWAVHAHTFSVDELHTLYHNRILHSVKGVSRHFLFARFAWDIFPRLRNFLSAGTGRRLKTKQGIQDFSAEETRSLCEGQGRYRSLSPEKSGSPNKRARQSADAVEADSSSFDSGIGGLDVVSSSKFDGVDLRHNTGYPCGHRQDVSTWRVEHERFEWTNAQETFNASVIDAPQSEVEEWKYRKGLASNRCRAGRRRVSERLEDNDEERRGRKRFRRVDAG